MHPAISNWPSTTFYDGRLQNGVGDAQRDVSTEFPELHWLDRDHPLFFMTVEGQEEMASSGTSYLNRAEAVVVEKVVTLLMKSSVYPEEIGVITPYQGQKSHVMSHMTRMGTMQTHLYDAIEVASVDSFQGREKDFIVLSCVRSNETQGIGFLRDPRRLNVAITRARYGVIILGNARLLAKNDLWNDLLHHLQDRDALMGSTFPALQPSMMKLPPLRNQQGFNQPGGYDHRGGGGGGGDEGYGREGEGDRRMMSYGVGISHFGNKDTNLEHARHWSETAAESIVGKGASAAPHFSNTIGVIDPVPMKPGKFDSRYDKSYEHDIMSLGTLQTQSRSIHSSVPAADRSEA